MARVLLLLCCANLLSWVGDNIARARNYFSSYLYELSRCTWCTSRRSAFWEDWGGLTLGTGPSNFKAGRSWTIAFVLGVGCSSVTCWILTPQGEWGLAVSLVPPFLHHAQVYFLSSALDTCDCSWIPCSRAYCGGCSLGSFFLSTVDKRGPLDVLVCLHSPVLMTFFFVCLCLRCLWQNVGRAENGTRQYKGGCVRLLSFLNTKSIALVCFSTKKWIGSRSVLPLHEVCEPSLPEGLISIVWFGSFPKLFRCHWYTLWPYGIHRRHGLTGVWS